MHRGSRHYGRVMYYTSRRFGQFNYRIKMQIGSMEVFIPVPGAYELTTRAVSNRKTEVSEEVRLRCVIRPVAAVDLDLFTTKSQYSRTKP